MNNLFTTPAKRKSFLGTGWSFPPQFIKSSDSGVVMVSEETDIWQSLNILFTTSTLERVLQPTYGCNLSDFIFDKMSVSTISLLEDMLKKNIQLHEPRIKLERLSMVVNELEGILNIELVYICLLYTSRCV